MEKYKLSIVTITHNDPGLKRTLDSVLAQKNIRSDMEHIIVDSLSDDGTEDMVMAYIEKAPYRVNYIREKDAGRCDAMNKGIVAAKGKYLSFMNAGDHFYDDTAVESIMSGNNDSDIVYGNLHVVDQGVESVYCPPDAVDFSYFLNGYALPHQASIIKRDLFDKIGLYDDSLKIVFDWKFFLVAICKYKCSYVHLSKTIATFYTGGNSSKNPRQVELEKSRVYNDDFSEFVTRKITTDRSTNGAKLETPVLFMVFNRPETTARVFSQIKKARPSKLYIASDGPRMNKLQEVEVVKRVRDLVLDGIDWNCEVRAIMRSENLGCGRSVSSSINWFFGQEEDGIILEDDCLPDETFFPYCAELLEKYRDDERVTHISGTATITREDAEDTYYYSKYFNIWGWATWRRAWNQYDFAMTDYPVFRSSNRIADIFRHMSVQKFWLDCFDAIYSKRNDTWDYQWSYANFINNTLAITPYTNLIKNIGFGDDATHTPNTEDKSANRITGKIKKTVHPLFIIHDVSMDDLIYSDHHGLSLGHHPVGDRPDIYPAFDIKAYRNKRLGSFNPRQFMKKHVDGLFGGRLSRPLRKVYRFAKDKRLTK